MIKQVSEPETYRLTGRGYPARYYVTSPYHPGEVAYIVPGESIYFGGRELDEAQRRASPATLNRQEGITPPQAAAMQWVADNAAETERWEWNDPHADPMRYNAAGEYLGG